MSGNNRQIFHRQVERTKLSRKLTIPPPPLLYHFVNFPNRFRKIETCGRKNQLGDFEWPP